MERRWMYVKMGKVGIGGNLREEVGMYVGGGYVEVWRVETGMYVSGESACGRSWGVCGGGSVYGGEGERVLGC